MAQSLENVESALNSGLAFEKFCQWVDAQGGDAKALTDFSRFPAPKVSADILAGQSGYLYAMDAQRIGEASVLLGAGRLRKEDPVDPAAGIVLHQTAGGFVEKGQRLLTLYASRPAALDAARAMLSGAWQFAQTPPQPAPLIYNRIG
jgi:thymidine phosphorylase